MPVEKGARRDEAEAQILELFDDDIDLVILARYMQILSGDFVDRFPNRVINTDHSFLPAFVGAAPYKQAKKRGVKLIGATAHSATPIIEQDRDGERMLAASRQSTSVVERYIEHVCEPARAFLKCERCARRRDGGFWRA